MIANILDGIVLGLQFGLLAAGLTLIYGLGGVLNLGYGQMAVTSAMTVAFALDADIPILPAVGLGLLAGAFLGLLLDLTLLRPVYRLRGEARVLLSLLLTLGLILMVIRAITRPIAHLSQVADRISLGEMDAVISIESKDEVGELGERFRRMQVSLKAAMEQLDKDTGEL